MITVGTFSKVIATGLRVGWVHARPEVIDVVARMRFDMGNSAVLHHMLAEYLDGGRLDDHIEQMRALYAEKMDILASALTEFADFAPDLVVLDLMLPGMDGLDACSAIRNTSNVPIVMLTSR